MLASRRAAILTTPSVFLNVERFDKGMEMTFRIEFWTGPAPTRKGSVARATAVEKYIKRIEGVTRIGAREQAGEKMVFEAVKASPLMSGS